MRLYGSLGILLALACLQSAMAQNSDTVWICREDTVMDGDLYYHMFTADTFPDNRGQLNMVDTGDKLQGKYVNFDYQFSQNSVDEHGDTSNGVPDTVFHIAPRPGYAGFKFYWDGGASTFYVDQYDSLVLWHKGPLPGHKVMMIWGQGSAGCGTPINYEYLGQFMSSSTWKRESFSFPAKRMGYGAAPDSPFVKKGLFELRMLIYNDSIGGDLSPTSANGNLKIDNMCFTRFAHAPVFQYQPQPQTVDVGKPAAFSAFAWGIDAASAATVLQWKKNGNPITDATFPTYTIASVQASDAGSYTVVATNGLGSVTSTPVSLTVNGGSTKKSGGCGAGLGLAIIPPLFYKAAAYRKRKKKVSKA